LSISIAEHLLMKTFDQGAEVGQISPKQKSKITNVHMHERSTV